MSMRKKLLENKAVTTNGRLIYFLRIDQPLQNTECYFL